MENHQEYVKDPRKVLHIASYDTRDLKLPKKALIEKLRENSSSEAYDKANDDTDKHNLDT